TLRCCEAKVRSCLQVNSVNPPAGRRRFRGLPGWSADLFSSRADAPALGASTTLTSPRLPELPVPPSSSRKAKAFHTAIPPRRAGAERGGDSRSALTDVPPLRLIGSRVRQWVERGKFVAPAGAQKRRSKMSKLEVLNRALEAIELLRPEHTDEHTQRETV